MTDLWPKAKLGRQVVQLHALLPLHTEKKRGRKRASEVAEWVAGNLPGARKRAGGNFYSLTTSYWCCKQALILL